MTKSSIKKGTRDKGQGTSLDFKPEPLNILFEDNHIVAVNKTHHDLVQKDATGDLSLDDKIKQYLKAKYNKAGEVFLGVVHRLDRPVTGVVLFARTSKALTRLTTMFREGEITENLLGYCEKCTGK